MTSNDALQVIAAALAEIAPEVVLADVDPTVPFASETDLDSMDLLSLATALHERTGVDIDDGDMPSPWSLDDLIAELARRSA